MYVQALTAQIKYTELPSFSEVFAAGTAAALVPLRSITRRIDSGSASGGSLAAAVPSLRSHPRVQRGPGEEETITYMAAGQTDAGPVCRRLLARLRAIQQGTVADPYGWVAAVTEGDVNKVKVRGEGGRDVVEKQHV